MKLPLIAAITLYATTAQAAPPPVGSDDWNIMAPYKEWVTTQHDRLGRWCCSIADGRIAEARINGNGHWEARILHPETVAPEDGPVPPGYVEVPDERVLRVPNPTGFPILWIYKGQAQCFAPPTGS